MSKLAGTLLILFGFAVAFIGLEEVLTPENLTPYAAYTSLGMGVLLLLVGIGHFIAPHKSFLVSLPLLVAFQLHMYCVALFYGVQKVWLFLIGFVAASILILYISYYGYRQRQQAD